MQSCSNEFSARFSKPKMSRRETRAASCNPPRCTIELTRVTNLRTESDKLHLAKVNNDRFCSIESVSTRLGEILRLAIIELLARYEKFVKFILFFYGVEE